MLSLTRHGIGTSTNNYELKLVLWDQITPLCIISFMIIVLLL